jgi:hypothetical protein
MSVMWIPAMACGVGERDDSARAARNAAPVI